MPAAIADSLTASQKMQKTMSCPKFQFYEIVRVGSSDAAMAEVFGARGVILGILEDGDAPVRYGVFIFRDEACWDLAEEQLKATGERARREDFYDGTSIRVQVDEQGRGWVAD